MPNERPLDHPCSDPLALGIVRLPGKTLADIVCLLDAIDADVQLLRRLVAEAEATARSPRIVPAGRSARLVAGGNRFVALAYGRRGAHETRY